MNPSRKNPLTIDLPFHRCSFDDNEINEVVDTLRSGWLTTGPKTQRFEEDFRDFTGCRHAVGLNSCTAGLHLALAASGLQAGDEVITTPMTFVATTNVLMHLNLKPVFVDIERDTLNLDPARIEQAITPRTRAILPVHFAGHPCDMDAINAVARRHNLTVIEDAAHALGAKYKGTPIGGNGNMAAFSFYANKNITTGEGGMLTVPDDALVERVRVLRLHGLSRDAWKRFGKEGYAHYDLEAPGYKYNMADINAALGIHQLKKVDRFQETRRRYAAIYDDAFKPLGAMEVLEEKPYAESARHIYVIAPKPEALTLNRDGFMQEMQSAGIGVAVHFRAIHFHTYYRETLKVAPEILPVASEMSDRVLSLPLYPRMTESDVQRVIDTVTHLVKKYHR